MNKDIGVGMEIEFRNCEVEVRCIIGNVFQRYNIFKSLKESALNEGN